MHKNPISTTVDFDADGVQHGFLQVPHSSNASAWGSVMIPICIVRNGAGPTALLSGGNHGDEYEGPIALFDLARTLSPDDITGRIIIAPAMNTPALQAATRVSPIDDGNLNRSFPGRPDGGITEIIADYFSRMLLPLSDFVLDIHSGGKTLDFLPFAAIHELDDKDQQRRCAEAMAAFGAPYSLTLLELDARAMYDTEAERQGKVFISTELGGAGTTRPETIAIAKSGVRNFLVHAGILKGTLDNSQYPTKALTMPSAHCFVVSEHSGMIEPCALPGDAVHTGQIIARVHEITRTGGEPVAYHAAMDGLMIGRHVPGLVQTGDCIAVIARLSD